MRTSESGHCEPHDDPQAATSRPDRCRARRARARGRAGARRAQGLDRVLQFADRRGREARHAGHAHPPRRPGEGRQRAARRQPRRPLRGHRRQRAPSRSPTRASCPTCSAKGRAWSPKARSMPAGTFQADSVLAKHDENYMPKEVADALKKQGHWKDDYQKMGAVRERAGKRSGEDRSMIAGARPLRAGAGARARAGAGDACRSWGARTQRSRADGASPGRPRSRSSASSRSPSRALTACYVRSDFSVVNVFENSHSAKPLDLQDHRRVGEPRRLDAAVGADPRRCSARWSRCSAATCRRALQANVLAVQALDRGRVLSLHPAHLESVPAPRRRRRSRAATSIRSCRTSASRSIRRCSISAMSASRSRSRSRSRR